MSVNTTYRGSSRYIYTYLTQNPALFRFWQEIVYEVLELVIHRTSLGNFLSYEFPSNCLSVGYKLVDPDGTEVREDDSRIVSNMHEIYLRANQAKLGYSHAVVGKFNFGGMGETWWWLEPRHITTLEIKPGTREITKLVFSPPLGTGFSDVKPITLDTKAKLSKVRLLGDYSTKVNEYRSWFESMIDAIISVENLYQQLSLLNIRVGSGVKKIMASADILADEASRKELENWAKNWGMNSLLIVPTGAQFGDEGNFSAELDFGTGSLPFEPSTALDILLTPISIKTGLPKTALQGKEEFKNSAEENRSQTNQVMQKTQHKMIDDLLWMHKLEFGELPENTTIRFNPVVEMDEMAVLELNEKRLTIIDSIDFEKHGIDREELFTLIGLDLEIHEDIITKRQEEIEINKAMMQPSDESDEETEQPDIEE